MTGNRKGHARRISFAERETLILALAAWALLGLGALVAMAGKDWYDLMFAFWLLSLLCAMLGVASFVRTLSKGCHTWRNSIGFIGAVLIVVAAFGILIGPSWPWRNRERSRRANCTSNLKQIWYACSLYAKDNAGAYPPDLAYLFGDYISDSQLFVCPTVAAEGHARKRGYGRFVPEAVCYCYVSGLKATDDKEYALAFDEEWNHGGEGIIVARVGGQVSWERDIEGFHEELDKQRASLAAEGRSMKVIRPTWSRWPERPAYPVRPWHERPGPLAGIAAFALGILGGAVVLIVRQHRAAKAAWEGDSADSPSGGC